MPAHPTRETPDTIMISEMIWCAYCLRFKKMTENKAVISTMAPLIIWYTDAAHYVRPTNMSDEAVVSKAAGRANQNGLMFVFNSVS